jgi:hypothetical protein
LSLAAFFSGVVTPNPVIQPIAKRVMTDEIDEDEQALPFIYEIHCYNKESPEISRFVFQGWADTKPEAIATGRMTLETGHPDPEITYPDGSPWGRVVVYWAQYNPETRYQDISRTEPIADLAKP